MFRPLLIASALALAACTTTMDEEVVVEEAAVVETDVVTTAMAADNLSTLVAAIQAADLVATLQGPGPFTVFAPTDAAFAALPPGTLDRLLAPENRGKLRALLAYHVLPGAVRSTDVAGRQVAAATAQGSNVVIDARTGIRVNDASVIAADIEATNGIIHLIDRVLVPQVAPTG